MKEQHDQAKALFEKWAATYGDHEEDTRAAMYSRDMVIECLEEALAKSLPNHYAGELNTERIKTYRLIHQQYSDLEEGTVRNIFCKGADWYKEQCLK